MKKFNGKKKGSVKEQVRGKEIAIDCNCDRNKRIRHVDCDTRMLGTEPKVFRVANSGTGLPKWKKR